MRPALDVAVDPVHLILAVDIGLVKSAKTMYSSW